MQRLLPISYGNFPRDSLHPFCFSLSSQISTNALRAKAAALLQRASTCLEITSARHATLGTRSQRPVNVNVSTSGASGIPHLIIKNSTLRDLMLLYHHRLAKDPLNFCEIFEMYNIKVIKCFQMSL